MIFNKGFIAGVVIYIKKPLIRRLKSMNKFYDNQSNNLIISFIVITYLVNPFSKAGAKQRFMFFID